MTIREENHGDEGPPKTRTTEWTIEDMMKNLPDVEDPPAVTREQTVTATPKITNNASPLTSQIEEDEEQDAECPLLEQVPIDQLPPRFQRLLKDERDPRMSVEFIPARLPKLPLCLYILPPIVIIIIYFFEIGVETFVISSDYSRTRLLSYLPAILVILGSIGYFGHLALKERKRRAPLYVKDRHGVLKPWPGDWKIGVYLIGKSALLDFDGNHAWLLPVNSITEFDHTMTYITSLVVRSGSVNFNHTINGFEDADKAKEIEDWHRRSTESSE